MARAVAGGATRHALTCKRLVLDLAGLEYISSAGIRVIMKTKKAMKKRTLKIQKKHKTLKLKMKLRMMKKRRWM